MSGPRHQDTPTDASSLQDQAETVRAYLVGLRGGGVFLSSSDAGLLRRWLQDQVPLWRILEGLDRAAEKRRAKRMRTPLSLQHAKPFVGAGADGGLASERVSGLQGLVEELRADPSGPVRELAAELACASSEEEAVRRITRFHETRWESVDQHPWLARAEEELGDLKELVSEERFRALCVETARDLHRQQHPALCATRVWDTESP